MEFELFSVSNSELQIFYSEKNNILKYGEKNICLDKYGFLIKGLFLSDDFFIAISSSGYCLFFKLENEIIIKSKVRLGNFLLNNILLGDGTVYITSISGIIYTVEYNEEYLKLISTIDLKSSIVSATLSGRYFVCLNSHQEILLYQLNNRFLKFEKKILFSTILGEETEIKKILCTVHPVYQISLLCAIGKNKLFILYGKSLHNFEKFTKENFNLHNIRDFNITEKGFIIPVLTDKLEIITLSNLVNKQNGDKLFTKLTDFSK